MHASRYIRLPLKVTFLKFLVSRISTTPLERASSAPSGLTPTPRSARTASTSTCTRPEMTAWRYLGKKMVKDENTINKLVDGQVKSYTLNW